jgi:hypothetical protein
MADHIAEAISELNARLIDIKSDLRDKFNELSLRLTKIESLVNEDIMPALSQIKVKQIINGDNIELVDKNGNLIISAKYGKDLDIPKVVDSLDDRSKSSALSAHQGLMLKQLIGSNYKVLDDITVEVRDLRRKFNEHIEKAIDSSDLKSESTKKITKKNV